MSLHCDRPRYLFILLEHLAGGAHGELAINGRQNRRVEQAKSRRYRRIDHATDYIAERTMRTENAGYAADRSEEHTSELQSLMRTSYAVFCLKKTKNKNNKNRIK